jgi:hypothetical protein
VSNRHLNEAWKAKVLGREKLVLLAQADHACEYCGLAWPGLTLLAEKTGIGKTALREALERLVGLGLLQVHSYGQGGRGCSTVYHVLPALPGAVAPCPKCQANLRTPVSAVPAKPRAAKTHRPSEGFTAQIPTGRPRGIAQSDGENPPAVRAVSAIPTGNAPETHRTTNAASGAEPAGVCAVATARASAAEQQPSVEPKPPTRACAREGQEAAAAPRASIRPRHTPGSVAESLARALPGLQISALLDGIPVTAAVAATPLTGGEAQTRGQRPRASPGARLSGADP